MSDELKHECGVAMVVLRKPSASGGDFGGTKLSLLLEKQHNRGQDGAGAAIMSANPEPGEPPYWLFKSASSTPLVDLLAAFGKRPAISHRATESQRVSGSGKTLCASVPPCEKIFLGHLRYATFGKNDEAYCHPFVHEASELAHTLLLAGNFNLTNAHELFDDYRRHGSFPTSKADGYLLCEMVAHELSGGKGLASALSSALSGADGAWTLCGMSGDGWAFATRDPCGIRPGFCYIDDDVVVVASERPAIQAAFDVPPESVRELPPGEALIVSPDGETLFESLCGTTFDIQQPTSSTTTRHSTCGPTTQPPNHPTTQPHQRSCAFERIYFSRANDADIHRERKALGAALLPAILKAADAPLEDIFFSYIPNSARIAFHGLLEELIQRFVFTRSRRDSGDAEKTLNCRCASSSSVPLRENKVAIPRFGEIAVKDAKFRTFIADAASRKEFYKHVYDVTYGLVRPGVDTLVVLDDSIVRGNTMRNAILPMLDRLGPKRIVVASSAPPIRYPDCYGIDMSTLGELVAFRALVNLLNGEEGTGNGERGTGNGEQGTGNGERELRMALQRPFNSSTFQPFNPLAELYARFTDDEHCAEIARLLTPPGMKAEVKVVFQSVPALRAALAASRKSKVEGRKSKVESPKLDDPQPSTIQLFNPSTCSDGIVSDAIGDWYFTGDYPTPGGYKVLHQAIQNYLDGTSGRSY